MGDTVGGIRMLRIKELHCPSETGVSLKHPSTMVMTADYNRYLEFVHYLNTVGVRYAILHNWEAVVRGKTSDIDIVLAAADLERLEACLLTRYRVLNMFHYEACSFYFVLTPKDDGRVLPFMADFSTHYWCRGRIFFTDEELLLNRRLWQGMWVVGPREELAYLLIKKIYDKQTIPQHQRIRLRQLTRELGQTADSVAWKHFGAYGKQLVRWIVHEQWDEIEMHIRPLRRSLRRQVLKHDRFNSLRYWTREMRRIWERWHYPTGICVAVVSNDQEKKKALISEIKIRLQGAFRRTALFSEIPGLIPPRYGLVDLIDSSRKPVRSFGPSWLRFPSCLLEYDLAFLLKIRPLLARSTLVFFDFGDNCLSAEPAPGRHTGRLGLVRLAQHLVPRPDIILILDNHGSHPRVEEEKAHARESLVRREVSGTAQEGSNALLLDESSSREEVAHRANEFLSAHLYERYLERRDVWFRGESCKIASR
jgi:hypothetical protein